MKIGKTFARRGQRYTYLGERPYWTRDSRFLLLAALQSWCADCGERFEFSVTQRAVRRGILNRRCSRHASQGQPVRKLHRAARAPKPVSAANKARKSRQRVPVAILAAARAAGYPSFLL